ncbi:MAG: hypothetical protein H0T41_11875 [Rhodobacteraceae bacterium]|nr:hypothetical protein [Paracoccaceae bacterium]
MATLRSGYGASLQELLIAALVALPFSGALAIWLQAAADWQSPIMIVVSGLLQGIATFWIAGYRREGNEE